MTTPNVPCFINEFGRTYADKVYATDTPATAIPNERVERVRAYLAKIEEGSGAFSRDRLTHAENCIAEMKQHAREAIAELGE